MRIITLFLLAGALAFTVPVHSQPPSALRIMQDSFNREDGKDARFSLEMTLIDKGGSERKRRLEIFSKDYGALLKTFLKFTQPADIAGTIFLSDENETGEDTQYLYLPALGRARRIVSSQKDLRFVNTDFTYEDMQRRRPEKDNHRLLKEEKYNGWDCWVVENIPLAGGTSQYSKRISWIDKESAVIVKVDLFDRKQNPCKKFSVIKLEKIDGIWTATQTLMEDLKEKHKTAMSITGAAYNTGLDDEIFTVRNLEK